MTDKKNAIRLLTSLILVPALTGHTAENTAEKEDAITVLDNRTLLRSFSVFRTPAVIGKDGKLKKPFIPRQHRGKLIKKPIPEYQSPMPEKNWRSPLFDDSEWKRTRAPIEKHRGQASGRRLSALHSATPNSIICARAKFIISDPGKTGNLVLSARYVGGIAVFVNGKELVRKHLPGGELAEDTLAEKYPDDLYVAPGGKQLINIRKRQNEEEKNIFRKRYRSIENIEIPSSVLRKGMNVVAFQLHRAPVNEAATLVERRHYSGMFRVPGLWAYVALCGFSVTAPAESTVRPNVSRPEGIQVWNCAPHTTVSITSYGDPGDPGAPIEIDAVRNGSFFGRFVISSDSSVENLEASLSPLTLKDKSAVLEGDAATLRCGRRSNSRETQRAPHLFDGLQSEIPEKLPLLNKRVRIARRKYVKPNGSVLPLWITVTPPENAPAGTYEGSVTVKAKGMEKLDIPVRCTVHGWTLPDASDYRMKQLNVFSPYSLALHYDVPLWSEKHMKLIEKSYNLMAAIGARRVDIDLVPVLRARSAPLNHTMFRLVPKQNGEGYTFDFSIAEKIFALAEKTMKHPLPLQVNCWGDDRVRDKKKRVMRQWATSNKHVPSIDPETGKLVPVDNPPPGSEENFKFWKPILDDLRKLIEKRGWWKFTALGHQSYCWQPMPQQVDVARRIWPDAVWNFSAHSGTLNGRFKGTGNTKMLARYAECVWTQGKYKHRGWRRLLEKDRDKSIWNSSSRNQHRDDSSLQTLLNKPEEMILRGHDGLGYMCSDFLPIPNPKRKGHYYLLNSKVGNVLGNSTRSYLAAGPEGPVATGRYEMFRAGVQVCEATIYLERSLRSGKIKVDLQKKIDDYLDSRSRSFIRGWHVNRRESDRKLFSLAAETAAAIK